jgi:hypothetical protein
MIHCICRRLPIESLAEARSQGKSCTGQAQTGKGRSPPLLSYSHAGLREVIMIYFAVQHRERLAADRQRGGEGKAPHDTALVHQQRCQRALLLSLLLLQGDVCGVERAFVTTSNAFGMSDRNCSLASCHSSCSYGQNIQTGCSSTGYASTMRRASA